jgi:hypothetical protein
MTSAPARSSSSTSPTRPATTAIDEMCRKLLANTVIENYRVEKRMKTAVIVFPGSNCDRDIAVALEAVTGTKPHMVWHGESELPDGTRPDRAARRLLLWRLSALRRHRRALAGGAAVIEAADRGMPVIGICNGFQVLTETGLLPGALMRNEPQLRLPRRPLTVDNSQSIFTSGYRSGEHRSPSRSRTMTAILRRRRDARPDRRRRPRRLPLCRTTSTDRRATSPGCSTRRGQRARHDAPPRAPHRSRAWRHRRSPAVRGAARSELIVSIFAQPRNAERGLLASTSCSLPTP